ncbi:MAG: GSCFA domain-containing protein [Sphingobacteriaceae bacterium]
MQLHLNYKPKPSFVKIDHTQPLFMIGSCFAENIGEKLMQHGFNTLINPNGILFNPLSIYHCLTDIIEEKEIDDSLLLQRNGLYFSYLHHGSIYNSLKDQLKVQINNTQKNAKAILRTCKFLVITFGTAYVYELQHNKQTVANCHKQNSTLFQKRLISVEEIVAKTSELINAIKKLNPTIQVIFTVSPVKYLKDGIEENNLSKATLLLAVNQLCNNTNCTYFPAYELVTDDLRDYRFYKEDMARPNNQAINYVWEKFSDTFFTVDTKQLNKEVYAVTSATQHQLLHPEGAEAKQFLLNLENNRKELLKKFPYLKL